MRWCEMDVVGGEDVVALWDLSSEPKRLYNIARGKSNSYSRSIMLNTWCVPPPASHRNAIGERRGGMFGGKDDRKSEMNE